MGPSKENGQLVPKRPKLPDVLQPRVFKGKVRERVMGAISACGHLSDWWVVR